MSGLQLLVWTHKKGSVPHSSGREKSNKYPTSTQQSNPTVLGRIYLPGVQHSYFIHMFCLFNNLVPSTFSSFVSSFWPLTDHNRYILHTSIDVLREIRLTLKKCEKYLLLMQTNNSFDSHPPSISMGYHFWYIL